MKASASAWAYAHAATGTRCGKKILSLLLALMVCLTLLPTAAMAEESGSTGAEATVAEVTINGGTPEYFSTLQAAFEKVKNCTEANNATIKLLANVTLNDTLTIDSGVFTIELNGCTVGYAQSSAAIWISGGTVTLSGNGTLPSCEVVSGTLTISEGNIAFPGFVNVRGTSVLNMNGGSIAKLFMYDSTTLNMTAGQIGTQLTFRDTSNGNLSGGNYGKIAVYGGIKLSNLLAAGCAYKVGDTLQELRTLTDNIVGVTVVKCPHTGETSSPCKYCNTAIYKTITFHTNGGTLTGTGVTAVTAGSEYTMQYEVGKSMTLPNTVTRQDYSFAGWYKDDETFTDGPVDTITADSSTDLTYYAKWESLKPEYNGTKEITLRLGIGQTYENLTITLPEIPAGAEYGVVSFSPPKYANGTDYTVGILNSGITFEGNTLSFKLNPVDTAGVYVDITIPVTGATNYNDYNIIVHLVYAKTQDAPAAPLLDSSTTNSITLKAIPNSTISGATAQYRINGGAWQDSPEFKGLSAGTTYTFEARYAETEEYIASPASAKAQFATQSGGGNYYYRKPDTSGTEEKKPSATTGDVGILAYGLTALGSYTGTALMLRRKKHED